MAAQQGSQWHLNHLLKWLHLYNVNVQAPPPDAANLSDGVVVAMVLSMIDPPWFHEDWLSKIKRNVGSNKILKVSNLKKVLERLVDYYEVHLDQRLSGFSIPDVNKIGEGSDENELCRLLQLVLGCAVHCERQEEFIQAILQMEEEVQQGIMTAIQELPGIQELAGGSLVPNSDSLAAMAGRSPNQTTGGLGFQNLLSQLEAANEERKLLAKERQKLNLQISHLQDEINHLQTEVESLRSGGTLESMDKDASKTEMLIQKREILRLTEELMKSDTAKEEFRIRCESFEQELSRMRLRQEDLQNAADENRSLKDEVDILRERSGRLTTAESTIDSMRKKVEEGNELKRQLRKLDEKNAQYVHQNMELEEELKKLGPWKSQLELQKKQISELQLKLDEERKTADKFELQFKNLQEKNETLNQEKERLMGERNKLTEANEELRFAQLNHGTTSTMIDGSPTTTGGVDTLDMIPPEIREKLLRLEHENRRLRKQQDGQQHSGPSNQEVLETVLGGLQERIDQLEAENRCSFYDNPPKKRSPLVDSCQSTSLSSKPVFAGPVSKSISSTTTLRTTASYSELAPVKSVAVECRVDTRVSRVEQLKEAFLSRVSNLHNSNVPKKPFQRSLSHGCDKALAFTHDCNRTILHQHPPSTTSSPLNHRRQIENIKVMNNLIDLSTRETPPPPVEAVVITRDSTPRSLTAFSDNIDDTDSHHVRPTDSFDSPTSTGIEEPSVEFDSLSTDFDNSVEDHFPNTPTRSYTYNISKKDVNNSPDDVIQVDSAFRGDRDSVCSGSVSVSSFSIISEAITASDRSFERCHSSTFFLTPRSTTRNSQSDTVSRKSFAKTLRKRKMFKVAANAMFSLCGP